MEKSNVRGPPSVVTSSIRHLVRLRSSRAAGLHPCPDLGTTLIAWGSRKGERRQEAYQARVTSPSGAAGCNEMAMQRPRQQARLMRFVISSCAASVRFSELPEAPAPPHEPL